MYATPDIFTWLALTLAWLRETILEETDGKDSEIYILICFPWYFLVFFFPVQKAAKLHLSGRWISWFLANITDIMLPKDMQFFSNDHL